MDHSITSSKSAKQKSILPFTSHIITLSFTCLSIWKLPPFFDGVASTLFPGTAFSWKNSLITSTSRSESWGQQIPPSKFHAPSKYFLIRKEYIKKRYISYTNKYEYVIWVVALPSAAKWKFSLVSLDVKIPGGDQWLGRRLVPQTMIQTPWKINGWFT